MAELGSGPLLSRRGFLKVGALAGGGLVLGICLPCRAERAGTAEGASSAPVPKDLPALAPNAWIRIHADERIELVLARSEAGQGVMTSLPMLLAEELEVGLDQIEVVMAPVAPIYSNRLLGAQATGQSTSARDAWTPLREAGAAARALMIAAAAQVWEVPPSECRAQRGRVHHSDGVRSLSYGELAATASGLTPPELPALKSREAWTLIGTSQQRLDIPEKVSGAARFGLDVRLPGLLFATLYRCPAPGSRVRSWRAAQASKVPGVIDVLAVRNGIAVLADSTWAAMEGRRRLEVSCRPASDRSLDSRRIRSRLEIGLTGGSAVARRDGDVSRALESSAQQIEAVYEVGFQPHVCMEAMNCTADVRADRCALYVPTQAQEEARAVASEITGLPRERVSVHTSLLGGGYGRRLEQDFVVDAVELSMRARRPVQVVWTREDDFRHDYYRPMTLHRLRGGLDAEGRVIAWFHRVVGPSVLARLRPGEMHDSIDDFMVEGAADIPYKVADLRVEYRRADTPAPVGLWRGGGYAHNSFAAECFVDELAILAGRDPLALRRSMLGDSPRYARLLDRVVEIARWGETPRTGRARGLALVSAFGSLIAGVAEVSVEDGRARVHQVFCVADCGQVVHPELVRGQIESGVVYGLTAALKGEITFTDGLVDQSGFDGYPLLRFDEMPEIRVDILPSDADPGGVSGLAVPVVGPAVANALRLLTGKAARSLPIRLSA